MLRKSLLVASACIAVISTTIAQNADLVSSSAHIEVTGTAKQEIIPDEIYVSITLRERTDGRDKITVDVQEKQLKEGLQSVGVSLDLLSLSDTESDYIKISWGRREVITSKQFVLKLADAATVGKVFEKLDELKIQDAYISRVDHSQIVELRKNLRVEAIQAAKAKSDYLLNAIGEETGRALLVREESPNLYGNYYNNRSFNYNSVQTIVSDESDKIIFPEVQFQKIKLEASVYVVFEIKEN